jgi:hypothetical protein
MCASTKVKSKNKQPDYFKITYALHLNCLLKLSSSAAASVAAAATFVVETRIVKLIEIVAVQTARLRLPK